MKTSIGEQIASLQPGQVPGVRTIAQALTTECDRLNRVSRSGRPMTPRRLADDAHIPEDTVRRIMRGDTLPNAHDFRALCRAVPRLRLYADLLGQIPREQIAKEDGRASLAVVGEAPPENDPAPAHIEQARTPEATANGPVATHDREYVATMVAERSKRDLVRRPNRSFIQAPRLPDTFGAALTVERITNRLRQRDVGELVGCVGSSISSYEAGSHAPNVTLYHKLCDLFPSLRGVKPPPGITLRESKPEIALAEAPAAPVLKVAVPPLVDQAPSKPGGMRAAIAFGAAIARCQPAEVKGAIRLMESARSLGLTLDEAIETLRAATEEVPS